MLKFIDKTKVFLTSDLHFGHRQKFVWESRGYTSVEHHDKSVIDTINKIVKPDDNLFMLGDFCLNTPIEKFEEYISSIKCQNMYFIWGNHPNPHFKDIYKPLVKKILGDQCTPDSEVYPLRYKNIIYCGHYLEINVTGQMIILNHYPISSWNNMNHGSWMIHGHEHSRIANHLPGGKSGKILDVGWDYFKTPLSFNDITEIMIHKEIVSIGHH